MKKVRFQKAVKHSMIVGVAVMFGATMLTACGNEEEADTTENDVTVDSDSVDVDVIDTDTADQDVDTFTVADDLIEPVEDVIDEPAE